MLEFWDVFFPAAALYLFTCLVRDGLKIGRLLVCRAALSKSQPASFAQQTSISKTSKAPPRTTGTCSPPVAAEVYILPGSLNHKKAMKKGIFRFFSYPKPSSANISKCLSLKSKSKQIQHPQSTRDKPLQGTLVQAVPEQDRRNDHSGDLQTLPEQEGKARVT